MSDDEWVRRLNGLADAEVSPRAVEMRRLATAARDVIELLVATEAPLEVLTQAADLLEAASAELGAWPHGRRYEGFAETTLAGGTSDFPPDQADFFEHSPIVGAANPLAPPLRLVVEDGVVHGYARFGAAYEGPPSAVHGGFVAAAFDEVLGMAQSLGGSPGMTGTLTVKYRRPTPLHTDLRFEARLDRQSGRKQFVSGSLWDGDSLCAEAEGLFISVDFSKIAEMMSRRDH
jgi:acyl-coenzyme A thioesterase PaaI-like protein